MCVRDRVVESLMVVTAILGMASPVSAADALPDVLPAPKQIEWLDTKTPEWTKPNALKQVLLGDHRALLQTGVNLINARLAALGLPEWTVLSDGQPGKPAIVFCRVVAAADEKSNPPELQKPGAYELVVNTKDAVLIGADPAGVFHGLMTLRQLIQPDGRAPCVKILDWPDLPVRGAYIAGGNPDGRVPELASLKMNLLLMEYPDFYRLDDPGVRAKWQACFDLCRAHFIEPVPELQSLGWGHFVLEHEPRAAEGVPVEKSRLVALNGVIAQPPDPPPPDLEVKNAGFEAGANNAAAEWLQEDAGQCVFLDEDEKYSGARSLRIETAGKTTKRACQQLACLPGTDYELGAVMKIRDVAGDGAYIEVYGMEGPDQLGDLLKFSAHRTGSREWQPETCRFSTGKYTLIRVYVRLQEGRGAAWFDDVMLKGIPPADPLKNVLITEAAPFVLTDETGTTVYEENKDYRLASGNSLGVGIPSFSEDVEPLRIEVLPGSRINEGQTVLATFTCAPPGSITCCPSEPLYQEFMRKAIRNVITYLKPKYIHLGHDEPRVIRRDARCTGRGISGAEIFVDDVKRMNGYIHEAGPDVRLMIWADAINPYHNEPSLGMQKTAELLPRDIILCPWWYDFPDLQNRIEKSVDYFVGLGFDTVGAPWYKHENVRQWAEILGNRRKTSAQVLGEIYTTWGDAPAGTDPWQALKTMVQYSWTTDAPPLDEFLKKQAP